MSCSSLPVSKLQSAIADSGTTNHFLCPQAQTSHYSKSPNTVRVKVDNGQLVTSNLMTHLDLKNLPPENTLAHIMPGFPDSLFSISNLCDAGLHCTFTPTNVQAFDPKTNAVKLQGRRDPTSRLWRYPMCDMLHNQVTPKQKLCHQVSSANNACDLPSATALVKFHHATAGFPVKETWCQAIKQGNYAT